jgi:hypothetical protein|tara:strand:+ start:1534 stop:1776 length:243 start_codon:yes stop_codon:yes gene_type:complete
MSMRVRDLQQYLGKFTNDMKGTNLSDCHIYIETQSGHLEEIRRIEVQESKLVGSPEPVRIVLKAEDIKRWIAEKDKKIHV